MAVDTSELPCIAVVRIRLFIEFMGRGIVSNGWGNTLRGGFGYALRSVSCALKRDECADCILGRNCAYGYLFETPITETDRVMRKYTSAPHPFVIEPEVEDRRDVNSGDKAVFGMVLVGQAQVYLPHILLAFEELGKTGFGRDRVPFSVVRIESEERVTLFDRSEGRVIKTANQVVLNLHPGKPRHSRFSIHIKTPMRIQVNGKISEKPTLTEIVESLRRRLFLLRHFHGDGSASLLSPDFIDAAAAAQSVEEDYEWREASRRSTRQGQEVPLGGTTGRMVCEGDYGTLEPLLRAGEYVHVGKNATFGLGGIRVEELHT